MESKIRKLQNRKKPRYSFIIITFILLSALQVWMLKSFYKEIKFELPKVLFKPESNFPISEITVGKKTASVDINKISNPSNQNESQNLSSTQINNTSNTINATENSTENTENNIAAATNDTTQATNSNGNSSFELSDIQKKIVLRLMKLPNEDIVYKYQVYPETGYPNDKYWISTDVVSVVLRDCGYDLMELIYKDMSDHIDAYPMDKKGTKKPDKLNDFRVVYFQQKFFQRNALELPTEFKPDDPANLLQWQPGDIVYFQIDEANPGKDVAGMVSNHKSDKGIPLIIMITSDLGKISEVDALSTLKVSGHYRYPYPELSK